jgi:hypothetical protein
LRLVSRIGLRRAILRLVAVLGTMALLGGTALATPTPERADKTYVAFFLGQGGYLFSWGIPYLAAQTRELGMEADIFGYSEVSAAWTKIKRKKAAGYRIALVGYSLGNTATTYIQNHMKIDLLLAIAQSSLAPNQSINKQNTKRSVLWHGPDILSNAGVNNGFDKTKYVGDFHPFIDVDPRVTKDVLDELKRMRELGGHEPSTASAQTTPPHHGEIVQTVGRGNTRVAGAGTAQSAVAAAAEALDATYTASHPAFRDVTCTQCWGFQAAPYEGRIVAPSTAARRSASSAYSQSVN